MKKKFFNEWEIVDKINDGSFSTVYKAVRTDGCVSAIKYISLPKSKDDMDRIIKMGLAKDYQGANDYFINAIKNEVEIMKRFNGNPYIVDCYDVFQENKQNGNGVDYYIRMEYIEDIKTYYSKGLIDIDEIIKLGIDVCSALELCSSINLVHGDIKPENIFVGNDGKYKLGDFGSAFNVNNSSLNCYGTLNYVSPEVYKENKVTSSTDIYSLGLLMYQLINGKLPFISKDVDEKMAFDTRMSGADVPIIRGVNKKLMDIVSKACSFDEKDRYKNATEMKKDLEKLPHINSKKIKVTFSSESRYESTIDINTASLNNAAKSTTIIRNKLGFKDRYNIKVVLVVLVFLVLLSVFGTTYAFSRNCDMGYVNKNGFCVKGYYYCESGYTLNADNKCQKTLESVDAKITYTCPSGYTLNGEYCVSTEVEEMKFVYKCANDFTLNEEKKVCEKKESADAVVSYTCPSGYVSAGNQCVTVTNIDATSTYGCEDSSYMISGTTCRKTLTKTEAATTKYTCDSGGTLNGTICDYKVEPTYSWIYYNPRCSRGMYNYTDRMCHYSESAKLTYSCSQGTSLGNGYCSYTTVDVKSAVKKYICPEGYAAVGDQCAKTSGIAGTPKYICPDDTKLEGSKCTTIITTEAMGMYECPEGYVTNGVACVPETLPTPVKKYSCSRVYTLNGGKCEKYDIVKSKAYYY